MAAGSCSLMLLTFVRVAASSLLDGPHCLPGEQLLDPAVVHVSAGMNTTACVMRVHVSASFHVCLGVMWLRQRVTASTVTDRSPSTSSQHCTRSTSLPPESAKVSQHLPF